MSDWVTFGSILVGLISCFFNALSYIIQKKAHLLNENTPSRPIYRHPVWIFGFLLLLIGGLISIATMGFLDQTTMSSLSSVTIVLSIIFSSVILKEAFTRWVLLQVILMLVGASLMLVFSNKVQREFTLDDMLFLYKRPIATVFLIVYACLFFILIAFSFNIVKRLLRIKQKYEENEDSSN